MSVFTVQAENIATQVTPQKAPKICLALSGGGARGFAHIGVLKQLEAMHIPIDCIAGTSMGAVVGGLYAAGLSATEIEKKLENLKLNDIALDRVARRNLPQPVREEDDLYPLGATLGVSSEGVRLPAGVAQASQFQELIQNWTAHLPPAINFDQLPIPFRAIATDLETGQMVVFDKGALHKAIRASMAAPGVFAPTEIDGRLLSDGGLVRNLPVDIARSMGADIVIAVNIGTPLLPRDKLQTLFNISQQMVNILTEQNVHAQKALLRPQDILIEPDLRDIGFLDFDRAKEASVIGEQATLALVEKLSELHLSGHLFVASQQMRLNPQLPTIRIGFVDIETNGAVPEQDIRRQLSIEIGSVYNAETINRKLAILNNAREFDSIGHELIQRDQQYGLRIKANGRNWGPHFVRFGLSLSSGFDGVGGYRLQVGHRRPWLTPGGLEWRNDIELGNTVKLHSELRQPLFEREGMYLAPYAEFSQDSFNTYIDNTRVAEFSMRTIKAGNDLAFRIGEQSVLGEARIGFLFSQYNITPKLGMVQLTDAQGNSSSYPLAHTTLQQFGFKTSVVIDQLSDSSFPRDGYKLGGSLFAGLDKSKTNFQELALDSVWAHSWSNHSVNLKFSGAGLFVKDSGANQTMGPTLGGFQRLSAYQQDQFRGNYMLYGSATYLLRAVNFEMAGQSLFLGTSLELGNTWDTGKEITAASLRKSLSVFAGFNSFMGPIYLGFAVGQNGSKNVFFQLGRQ
ncbi:MULTISPECIES: patatin-like phospholipase family protein [unclassified Undibacterium]|uniref:patatin-like phospholipase family protein n=1 Tax=unclassified Undibacterium TaxID=2630295 RepID=UPI002AC96584|nr:MULTISPECIES: patatin-like phospholipase family protein [unclassified Undibacterium]MEB0216637.1 patatin-like phospholipase family protein [Undibacterium sp. 5I2]WPX42354.1 patatin-like phospholipase family protein [Undibacterium sp. CCC3.4]